MVDAKVWEQKEWWQARQHLMNDLTQREQRVVKRRLGIPDGDILTLADVARRNNVGTSRIGQIIDDARKKVERWEAASEIVINGHSPVSALHLPTREYNQLMRAGVTTAGDLCSHSSTQLKQKVHGLGDKGVLIVCAALKPHGLALRNEEPDK